MILLILSLMFLAAGPIVYSLALEKPMFLHKYEYALVVLLTAVVFLQMMPSFSGQNLVPAISLIAAGVIPPLVIERTWKGMAKNIDLFSILILIIGLAIHSFNDGVIISQPFFSGWFLPAIIVLHRIPDSILIWFMMVRFSSIVMAAGALSAVAICTILGFFWGRSYFGNFGGIDSLQGTAFIYFQAFAFGSLLHLLFHKPHHQGDHCTPHNHKH